MAESDNKMKPSIVSSLDPAQVKILLLPLTNFPENSWQKWIQNFSEIRRVSIANFEKQIDSEDDPILKKLGNSGCYVHYNFITSIDPNSKYFIDFQLYQRIFGIIGLVNGSEFESETIKSSAEESLKKFSDSIQYEVVTEIFCIEPAYEDDKNIVAISNKSDLKEELDNFTIKIMTCMSNLFKEISQRSSIPSPCGIEDYSGTASRSSTTTGPKSKMKLSGRVQKLLADLHVLTGSFSDAVACYVSATEDAKASNDSIWNAAAQEGFNLALCLQNEQILNDDHVDIYKILIDRLMPLSTTYERSGTPVLSIDLQITCSRVHRFIHQGTQALVVLSEAWKSCNLLAFDEKIVAYNLVLKELASAGNWRKWSLYMVQLSQTLKTAQKPEMALIALSKTLSIYNLEKLSDGGWPVVQSSILKEMVKLSETHSNHLLYFLYGWMYLSHSNRWQDQSEQVQIIEKLKKKSTRDMFSLKTIGDTGQTSDLFCCLPIFNSINLEKGNDGLFVSANVSTTITDPFIYNPNNSKIAISSSGLIENNSLLIADEPAKFILNLNNPFLFPITLKNIRIITDHSEVYQDDVSIVLPPMIKNRQIPINLIVKKERKIEILGFSSNFMNVEIKFLISNAKKLNFCVIPKQAILNFSSVDFQNGLQIFEGESFQTSLNFISSNSKISEITFKILEDLKFSFDSEFEINEIIFGNEKVPNTFTILDEEMTNFEYEKEFKVPLKLFGSFNNLIKSANLEIFYSSNSPKNSVYWKKLNVPLYLTIFPLFKVEQFSFFPITKKCLNSSIFSQYSNNLFNENNFDSFVGGSFIISNLDSSISVKLSIDILNLPCKIEIIEEIPAESSKRIFFIMPKLVKTFKMKNEKKLPLNEKQIASVRKLRRPGKAEEFVDATFEDFIYDHDQFWIKSYLIDNLHINWEIIDDKKRSGLVSLIQSDIPIIYHDLIFKEHEIVQADCIEFKNAKIGQEISITFKIWGENESKACTDYKLKIFPVVVLNDKEVGLNFDKVIRYSGCLDSFVRGVSYETPKFRKFKFYPTSTATVKIIYQAVEIDTGTIYWGKNPIIIETKQLIK